MGEWDEKVGERESEKDGERMEENVGEGELEGDYKVKKTKT